MLPLVKASTSPFVDLSLPSDSSAPRRSIYTNLLKFAHACWKLCQGTLFIPPQRSFVSPCMHKAVAAAASLINVRSSSHPLSPHSTPSLLLQSNGDAAVDHRGSGAAAQFEQTHEAAESKRGHIACVCTIKEAAGDTASTFACTRHRGVIRQTDKRRLSHTLTSPNTRIACTRARQCDRKGAERRRRGLQRGREQARDESVTRTLYAIADCIVAPHPARRNSPPTERGAPFRLEEMWGEGLYHIQLLHHDFSPLFASWLVV